jgi:hypothetical protein
MTRPRGFTLIGLLSVLRASTRQYTYDSRNGAVALTNP